MVSIDAKEGFNSLLSSSMEAALHSQSNPGWNLQFVEGDREDKEGEFIMLTIVSPAFRLFVLLKFCNDENMYSYVAKSLNVDRTALSEDRYYDYLCEVGNSFCGTLKRELGKHFSYMGMSTPSRLSMEGPAYLKELTFDHHRIVKASDAASKIQMFGGIYLSAYGDIDFKVSKQADAEVNSGALELF